MGEQCFAKRGKKASLRMLSCRQDEPQRPDARPPVLTSSTSRSALLLDSTVSTCRSESNLGLLNRGSTRLISSSKCSQSTGAAPGPPSPPEEDLRYCSRAGGPAPALPGG